MPSTEDNACSKMYIYIYIYMCKYVYIYICIDVQVHKAGLYIRTSSTAGADTTQKPWSRSVSKTQTFQVARSQKVRAPQSRGSLAPKKVKADPTNALISPNKGFLDSQVAGNYRPLYPKVDHNWYKVPK